MSKNKTKPSKTEMVLRRLWAVLDDMLEDPAWPRTQSLTAAWEDTAFHLGELKHKREVAKQPKPDVLQEGSDDAQRRVAALAELARANMLIADVRAGLISEPEVHALFMGWAND